MTNKEQTPSSQPYQLYCHVHLYQKQKAIKEMRWQQIVSIHWSVKRAKYIFFGYILSIEPLKYPTREYITAISHISVTV